MGSLSPSTRGGTKNSTVGPCTLPNLVNELNQTPSYTLNLGAQYTFDTEFGAITPRVDTYLSGRVQFLPDNLSPQGSYTKTNINVTWISKSGKYRAEAFVHNLEYQQNPGGKPFPPLDPGCFVLGGDGGGAHSSLLVVISVDPAQSTQAGRSYFVVQVWVKNFDGRHILRDQLRTRIGYDDQRRNLLSICKRHMPSIVLIENNIAAEALEHVLRRAGFRVKLVPVGNRSKLDRFAAHVEFIRQGNIMIGDRVPDPDLFIDEMVSFPNVEHDDQVDALTQYLDYVTSGETIPPRRQRAIGVVARSGW